MGGGEKFDTKDKTDIRNGQGMKKNVGIQNKKKKKPTSARGADRQGP